MDGQFFPTILLLEKQLQEREIDHRFVGGVSFGGLLNDKTTWDIDIKKRRIKLHNYNQLSLTRDDKTTRDIDIITFTSDIQKIYQFKIFLEKNNFDYVTVENAIYTKNGKRNHLFQFVTAIEIDQDNNPSLVFGSLHQFISWKSLESWTVVIGDIAYIVRNPIADYFAYQFRSPSGVKPKDRAKVLVLKKLITDMFQLGEKNKINYASEEYFGPWQDFLLGLQETRDPQIIIKKSIMRLYWSTIGTGLAHGIGLPGKVYSFLSNKFTGGEQ